MSMIEPSNVRLCVKCNKEKCNNDFYTPECKKKKNICRDCYKRIARLYRDGKGFIFGMLKHCKESSKKRGIKRKSCAEYDLSFNQIQEMKITQQNKCEISGIELQWKTKSPFMASIDRIDPNRGYTRDNVRLVCWIVNCGMNNFSFQDFLFMCAEVNNHNFVS